MARQRARMSLPAAHDHIAIRTFRIAAEKLVGAEPPEVAGAADARAGSQNRRLVVTALGGVQRLDPKIDLVRFEADRLEVEIEFDAGQSLELFTEPPIVPLRDGCRRS
jgi:hypothetical protein